MDRRCFLPPRRALLPPGENLQPAPSGGNPQSALFWVTAGALPSRDALASKRRTTPYIEKNYCKRSFTSTAGTWTQVGMALAMMSLIAS